MVRRTAARTRLIEARGENDKFNVVDEFDRGWDGAVIDGLGRLLTGGVVMVDREGISASLRILERIGRPRYQDVLENFVCCWRLQGVQMT